MYKMAELFAQAHSFPHYAKLYSARLAELLDKLDMEALGKAAEKILEAREAGRSLYIIGNGGSAAIAAHMVNDLVAGAYLEGANLRCADLRYANLDRANLRGANLDGANLSNAYLAGAK